MLLSNFYGLLSPGPLLGSAVTVYRYKSLGASTSASVTSLLASRMIEAAAFVFWGSAAALLDPQLELPNRPLIAFACVLTALGVLALFVLRRDYLRQRTVQAAWHEILRSGPRVAFRAALPATVQVLLAAAAFWTLAASLQLHVDPASAVWICAAVYVVVLLPISIAGMGVREAALIRCLAVLGVPASAAVALSFLLLLDQLVSAALGGLIQLRLTARRTESAAV